VGRFPLIAAAGMLRAQSFLIDGEAVACDGDGLPEFDRLRYRRQDGRVFLFAFDLIELNGRDLRREPLEVRKRALAAVLRSKARAGIQFNDHFAGRGCFPPRLQARARRHCIKAEGLALPLGSLARLALE
jgi:ATP-dependent DNA ligase